MEKEPRASAGKKVLDPDYLWPKGFGGKEPTRNEVSSIVVEETSSQTSRTFEPSRQEKNVSRSSNSSNHSENLRQEHSTVVMIHERVDSSTPEKRDQVSLGSRSKSKHSSRGSEIRKKQKALQVETLRRQIDVQKMQDRLRILELQNEIDELEENCVDGSFDSLSTSKSLNELENIPSMQKTREWVSELDTIPKNYVENPVYIDPVQTPIDCQTNSVDLKMLCQSITNAFKEVSHGQNHEKFMSRQVVERDFPYFDGNPEEWPVFYSSFTRISSLCQYSNEEKLVKLNKCLNGQARQAVSSMMLSPDNINQVLNTLKMRFGRPDIIIEKLLSKIKTYPIIKEYQMESLIYFSNHVCSLVATIKSLDQSEHLQNPEVLKCMVQKIPDTLKLRWGEEVRKHVGKVTLITFSDWVEDLAQSACYVSTPKFDSQKPHKYKVFENTFMTYEDTRDIACSYCENKEHRIQDCKKFKQDDVQTRWKIVSQKKLCFSCLKPKHRTETCRTKRPCGINRCERLHKKLLHNKEPHKNNNKSEENLRNYTENVHAIGNGAKNVLLRMVKVKIFGENGNFMEIVALCDEASTVTLADKSIIDKLGLDGKKESLCLQWTNEMVSENEQSLCLDLKISGVFPNAKVFTMKNVRTVENLALPLQIIKEEDWKSFPYLAGISFAEIKEKPLILLGQDNIRLTVARKVIQGPENSPLATKTDLGYILHGSQERHEYESQKLYAFHICDRVCDHNEDLPTSSS